MSRGRHVRRPEARRRLRRHAIPLVLCAVGFVVASTGVASGYWNLTAKGPGQSEASSLDAPGTGSASDPGGTKLSVSWGTASGLPSAGGYEVLRSTTSGGPYKEITDGSCNPLNTVVSSATSCTDDDSALDPGTTYYYVVESVDGKWTSAHGAQFSGTTAKVTPQITTAADPASVIVGGSVGDQATLSGAHDPSGTLTWKLFADATCTGTPVFTSAAQSVSANSTYTSSSYTTTKAGTYTWAFAYSGDAANAAVIACGGSDETLSVNQATPSLGTSASSDVTVGQSVRDTATLAGGYLPSGTITYTLYGPSPTAACAAPVGQVSAKVTSGNGSYTSPPLSPPQAGTYWWIANYGGDTDNTATTNTCGASGETSVVNRATPTIATGARTPPRPAARCASRAVAAPAAGSPRRAATCPPGRAG